MNENLGSRPTHGSLSYFSLVWAQMSPGSDQTAFPAQRPTPTLSRAPVSALFVSPGVLIFGLPVISYSPSSASECELEEHGAFVLLTAFAPFLEKCLVQGRCSIFIESVNERMSQVFLSLCQTTVFLGHSLQAQRGHPSIFCHDNFPTELHLLSHVYDALQHVTCYCLLQSCLTEPCDPTRGDFGEPSPSDPSCGHPCSTLGDPHSPARRGGPSFVPTPPAP